MDKWPVKTVSIVTKENFEPQGYLELNTDLISAFGRDYEKAYAHLLNYGLDEGRSQLNYSQIVNARKEKVEKFRHLLDLTKAYEISTTGAYDFLSLELRKKFRVFDTSNVSSHIYAYEGFENKDDCIILDCGCGFRNDYYSNVVYFDIVNYLSTDVIGVGEQLPFKDNSFDYVFSYAVIEHLTNPQLCAAELARVVKPNGLIYCDAPFMVPFHGYPDHYFNFTPSGARLLFDANCEIISQTVPSHFHPIHSLQWICREWARGVAENDHDEFMKLSVKEFSRQPDRAFHNKKICSKPSNRSAGNYCCGYSSHS